MMGRNQSRLGIHDVRGYPKTGRRPERLYSQPLRLPQLRPRTTATGLPMEPATGSLELRATRGGTWSAGLSARSFL